MVCRHAPLLAPGHALALRQLLGCAPVTERGLGRDRSAVAGGPLKTGMKTGGQRAEVFSQPSPVAGVVAGLWLLQQSLNWVAAPVVERILG